MFGFGSSTVEIRWVSVRVGDCLHAARTACIRTTLFVYREFARLRIRGQYDDGQWERGNHPCNTLPDVLPTSKRRHWQRDRPKGRCIEMQEIGVGSCSKQTLSENTPRVPI